MAVKLYQYTYTEHLHLLDVIDFHNEFLLYIINQNYILNNFKQRQTYQNKILNKQIYITIK